MKYLEEQDVYIINGDEMRKIQHALWMARAMSAKTKANYWRYIAADNVKVKPIFKRYECLYEKWKWAERKCREKAKAFE